jgi:N-methylhydantoinase B
MPPVSDIFLTEVIRNGLASIAEEMTLTVLRSARSPALREAGDLSSAVTDDDGNLIAQGRDLPIHLGVMAFSVKALLSCVGKGSLAAGDVWIVNDPQSSGNHLPDVKVIRPVFLDGQLIAFCISLAHWSDVGGGSPGSYNIAATDLWQEGLQIPPVKIMIEDRIVSDVLSLIMANVRGRPEREGDLFAQIAAVRTSGDRVVELAHRFGAEVLRGAVAHLLDLSEQQIRGVIHAIPDGRYSGQDFVDGTQETGPVRVAVDITIAGTDAIFDFSRSGDAVHVPLNTTPTVVAAGVDYFLKAIAGENVYRVGGSLRPAKIVTRPGSILEPINREPLVAGNHETSNRVVDAILDAMSSVIPDQICAGGCGTAGLTIFSGRNQSGQWWTLYETHGGGEGANADRCGESVTRVYLGNMMNTPAEFIEAEYPVQVVRSAVRAGSGGRGRHRGGDGLIREYRMLTDDVKFIATFERRLTAPRGLLGGEPGLPFRIRLIRHGEEIAVTNLWQGVLNRDDSIIVETAGGGGYGVT